MRAVAVSTLIAVALIAGCNKGKDKNTCVEGASAACACPSGAHGAQVCHGGAFGPCQCTEPTPPTPTETKPADTEAAHVRRSEHEGAKPMKVYQSDCKLQQAVIGLDKVTVICHIENPDSKPHMVHFVGMFETDNFPTRSDERDIAVSPGTIGDAQIDFDQVNLGKSQHPRCECKFTSSEGYPIAQ